MNFGILPEMDAGLPRIKKGIKMDEWAARERGEEKGSGCSSSESVADKTGRTKSVQRSLAAKTKR